MKKKTRLLSFLLPVILLTSCQGHPAWQLGDEEILARLERGETSFLEGMEPGYINTRRVEKLVPGGNYYLGLLFLEEGDSDAGLGFLKAAAGKSPEPWNHEALAEGVRRLILEDFGRGLERWYPGDLPNEEGLAAYAGEAAAAYFYAVKDHQQMPGRADRFPELFARYEDPDVLESAYFYLQAYGLMPEFSRDEQAVITARIALLRGDREKALSLYEGLIRESARWQASPSVFRAYRMAVLRSGNGAVASAAAMLEALAPQLEGTAAREAWENAGRLRRELYHWQAAAADFENAWSLAQETAGADEQDVELWFYLDSLLWANPALARNRIRETLPFWHNPQWYQDLAKDYLQQLVSRGEWAAVGDFYREGREKLTPAVRSQCAWLVQRAPGGAAGSFPDDVLERDLDLGAVRPYYYQFLYDAKEDKNLVWPFQGALVTPAVQEVQAFPYAEYSADFAAGFFAFGLERILAERLFKTKDLELSAQGYRRAAQLYASSGDYPESIRAISRAFLVPGFQPTGEDWLLLYPRPYRETVTGLCHEYRLPESLVYGLLRQESLFEADVVSYAGAVGLSQVMPETGEWLMEKYRMDGPMDLTDPELNLTLGIRFLSDLIQGHDSPVHALMAYNAGPSRVRRWASQFRHYPLDLYTESVPIAQPRDYVRKIVASAVIYGYLYEGLSVRETVYQIMPPEVW